MSSRKLKKSKDISSEEDVSLESQEEESLSQEEEEYLSKEKEEESLSEEGSQEKIHKMSPKELQTFLKRKEIQKVPIFKGVDYPPGVLRSLRGGRKTEASSKLLSQMIWRDQRKGELEEMTTEEVKKHLNGLILKSKKKGNDALVRRIKLTLNKGDKVDFIKLILDVELKEVTASGKLAKIKIPTEDVEDFEYKKFPVPDVNFAKELDLPTKEERLVPVQKIQYVIPGLDLAEPEEFIKVRTIGNMILTGQVEPRRAVALMSQVEEYESQLKEMDIDKLAQLVIQNDIAIDDEDIASFLESLLEFSDLKDPEQELEDAKEKIAILEAQIQTGERELPLDQLKTAKEEAEDTLAYLEKNLEKAKKTYAKNREDAQLQINKLEAALKKKGTSIRKIKRFIIGALLDKLEEQEAAKYVVPEEKVKIHKNPHNKNYPLYTRVKFVSRKGDSLEGVVVGFAEQGIDISVVEGRGESKIYKISYKNPKLEIISKPKGAKDGDQKIKYMKFEGGITKEDLYDTPVTLTLRKMIVEFYMKILNDLIASKGVEPSKTKTKVVKLPIMSWNEFVESKYERYRFNVFKDTVKIDEDKLMKKAEKIRKDAMDEDKLLEQLASLLEDSETGQDILWKIEAKQKLTPLEAYLAKNIGSLGAEAANVRDTDLAVLIKKSIQEYKRNVPVTAESIFRDLKNLMIYKAFRKSKEDSKGLEKFKNSKKIKKEYDEYKNTYGSETKVVPVGASAPEGDEAQVRGDVQKFEDIIYNTSDGTMKNYLLKVLMPYLFLDGPLSTEAKFFRAKIANGKFKISGLASANLAHFLPEFSASNMNVKGEIENAYVIIDKLLEIQADRALDLYLAVLNPTERKKNQDDIIRSSEIAEEIKRKCHSVVDTCNKQSGTGKRPLIRNGKYVYKMVGVGKNKVKVNVMEDIPEGDVVLCYDKKNNKFQCFDSNEVLRDIKTAGKSKPKDKNTGFVYPDEFIEKLKKRAKDVDIPGEEIEEEKDIIYEPKPSAPIAERKRIRKVPIHKPSEKRIEKGDFKEINKMLLVGDAFDLITLFSETLDFEGADGLREIPITTNKKSSANVVVLSFDVQDEDAVAKLEDAVAKLKKPLKNIKSERDVYLIGTGPSTQVLRVEMNNLINESEKLEHIKKVFYSDSYEEEDIIDTLVNVVIDVEGPDVISEAQEREAQEWAYRADTPPLERKLRRQAKKEKEAREEEAKREKEQAKRSKERAKKETKERPKKEKVLPKRTPTPPKPVKLTKRERANLEERRRAKEADPLLRAALVADLEDVKKYLPVTDDYDVVEVYKEIYSNGGSADVLKLLRTDPRIMQAALTEDMDLLKMLADYGASKGSDPRYDPTMLYKEAKKLGPIPTKIHKLLFKYDSVKRMLKEEFEARRARERK